MSQYTNAQRLRNEILEFVREKPGAVLFEVLDHIGLTKTRVSQLLARMVALRELRQAPGGKGRNGHPSFRFFAMVDQTITAKEVLAAVTRNLGSLDGRTLGSKNRLPGDIVTRKPQPPKHSNTISRVARPVHRLFGGLGD